MKAQLQSISVQAACIVTLGSNVIQRAHSLLQVSKSSAETFCLGSVYHSALSDALYNPGFHPALVSWVLEVDDVKMTACKIESHVYKCV